MVSCPTRLGLIILVGCIIAVHANYVNPVEDIGVQQNDGAEIVRVERFASWTDIPPVSFNCPSDGYFTHPTNCSRFFHCVTLSFQVGQVAYERECLNGTVFDESIQVCNHPSSVQGPCGINQISWCRAEGYFTNPSNSSKFYRCANNTRGGYDKTDYECVQGTIFDETESVCNYPQCVNQGTR